MYPYNYNNTMIRGNDGSYPIGYQVEGEDRFFWAPFVVGGLAGTALGYGIANNNQLNNNNNDNGQPCCGGYYYYPVYQNPYYPGGFNNFNNFYY